MIYNYYDNTKDNLNDMIKTFFATFFIAELIIAFAVIAKIWKIDRYVNSLNSLVVSNKLDICLAIKDFKWILVGFVYDFNKLKNWFRQRREEYMLRVAKTSLIYALIFILKGKYKKSVMVYQFVSEVYSGLIEAPC